MTSTKDVRLLLEAEGLLKQAYWSGEEKQVTGVTLPTHGAGENAVAFTDFAPNDFDGGVLLAGELGDPPTELVEKGVHVYHVDNPKASWALVVTHYLPELWASPRIMGKPVRMGANCSIGGMGFGYTWYRGRWLRVPHCGGVYFGEGVELGSNVCIDRGTIGPTFIGDGVKIDNLVHVAHNAIIGTDSLLVAGCVIGGSADIGSRCFIGMNASVRNKVSVGNMSTVGMGAVVTKDVPAGVTVMGNPARIKE